MPTRWAAAPSSDGAGILLQSTSNRFFWFIFFASAFDTSRPHGEEAHRAVSNHEAPQSHPSRRAPERAPPATSLRSRGDEEIFLSPRPHQAALLPAPVALLLALAL